MVTKNDIKQIKLSNESRKKPTPEKWVKIGDSIQDLSMVVAGASAFTGSPIIPFISLLVGKIGKIITNFASE